MMFVTTPYPGFRPADLSAPDGFHLPVMTSWQDGFGDCGVIQNQIAVLNEMTASVATRSGLFSRSTPMAFPHLP